MTGITDVGGVVASGYTVAPVVPPAGTGTTDVQTLHMNPQGLSEPMGDVRMTPPELRQGNPYGVGVNIDYMA